MSGIFVKRLVQSLPSWVEVNVITPCSSKKLTIGKKQNHKIQCFRYAPRSWQILAHNSGGIPVAIRHRKILILLLPIFIGSMFIACIRVASSCDLIHANWSINGLIAGIVGIITGTPVITTLRGEDVTKSSRSKIFNIILKLCVISNKKIICVSEAIYDQLLTTFPCYSNKLEFIPNGVDNIFLNIEDMSVQKQNNKKEVLEILTIGSLIPRKGIKDIINALKHISETDSNFSLSIIGDGVEENNLKQLVQTSGLSEKVKFLGNISPQDIPHYFAKADVFILASYSEGRPNVVLESFAAGVPVIATQIDGVIEIVEENITGLLFLPGNSTQLATKIKFLKNNPEMRNELAKKGRELIINNELLWPKIGKRYADTYKKCIDLTRSVV